MTTKVCRHFGHTCRRLAAAQRAHLHLAPGNGGPSALPSTSRSLTTCTQARPRHVFVPSRTASRRSYHYYTSTEKDHERIITTSMGRIEEFDKASKALSEGSGVDEAIELSRILKELGPLKNTWEEYLALRKQLVEVSSQLNDPDPDISEMFQAEHKTLCTQLDELVTERLPTLLLPTPAIATLPVIMSLNAGIGGAEAASCTDTLARMYLRFAQSQDWQTEIVSSVETTVGQGITGLREMTIRFMPPEWGGEQDAEVYGMLQWEKGVHRIQRIPLNDAQGRVQTSTVTIVVLPIYPDTPDAPLVEAKDVKTEVMRSRGAGGQHVNKTESAVRLTHVPTGITVSMQDSRSQHQNRDWAWQILRARLSERKHQEEVERKRASRRSQVKGASRGDKVRTYNFTQDRITDHRINVSWGNIGEIVDGEGFINIINDLRRDFRDRRLDNLMEGEDDIDE